MKTHKNITNPVLLILLTLLGSACTQHPTSENTKLVPEFSRKVQLRLVDSLGVVNVSVPDRYDTSFRWVHYSDCGMPCNEVKYRFQPKALPINKETGWIYSEPNDSIDQFTVMHSQHITFSADDTLRNDIRHARLKDQLKSDSQNLPIVFDTILNINDRYFSIIAMEKSDSIFHKRVLCVTTIQSNVVTFKYELATRDTDSVSKNFISKSIELLKSIQIGKGM